MMETNRRGALFFAASAPVAGALGTGTGRAGVATVPSSGKLAWDVTEIYPSMDMTKPEPYCAQIATFGETIDQIEALLA